jgi:pantoate kinase
MKKAVIEIESSQILYALEQLSSEELKKIIDTLFLKRLLKKPELEDVCNKSKKHVSKYGLKPEIVEEAIQWVRKQK